MVEISAVAKKMLEDLSKWGVSPHIRLSPNGYIRKFRCGDDADRYDYLRTRDCTSEGVPLDTTEFEEFMALVRSAKIIHIDGLVTDSIDTFGLNE